MQVFSPLCLTAARTTARYQKVLRKPRYRCLSTASSSSNASRPIPWFIDADSEKSPFARRHPPHIPVKGLQAEAPPLPYGVPQAVKELHSQLIQSPHLEPSQLLVREPPDIPAGPPLPLKGPQGRRKRGSTYSGEGVYEQPGGIWNWVVLVQVKEGTEKRGAIESVVRLIRRTLLKMDPPLPLPPNAKRRVNDTWAMIDAGEFAVHVMSREAKEKFFTRTSEW